MKHFYIFFLVFYFVFNSSLYGQSYVQEASVFSELITSGNVAFFGGASGYGNKGMELWRTDGTKHGTYILKDINPFGSSNPRELTLFNGEIYFSADDGYFGNELWKTDGTREGTVLLKNIRPESVGGHGVPNYLTVFNDELYFLAQDYYIGVQNIYKTDGTEVGTVEVYNSGSSGVSGLFVANNKLYTLQGGIYEVNVNTGTLSKVSVDETDGYTTYKKVTVINNELYFVNGDSHNLRNFRLYKLGSDNTPIMLQEYTQPLYGDVAIHNLTKVGNEVYFSITTNYNNQEDTDVLWKTDGTNEGTIPIKTFSFNPHLVGSQILNFVEYKNQLYFNSGNENGNLIWKSDGTESGTVKALDLNVNNLMDFMVFNNNLYFTGSGGLWVTDGFIENTKRVTDLALINRIPENPINIQTALNTVFFEVTNQGERELYTINEAPLLEVNKDFKFLNNNSKIYLETKIDSVATTTLKIKNRGRGNLIFSKIEIVGQDFYIDGKLQSNVNSFNLEGNFPQTIKQNEAYEIKVTYYPSSSGLKTSVLNIYSNDINNPLFSVDFDGFADNEVGGNPEQTIRLGKEITFDNEIDTIEISENSISENNLTDTTIGTLIIPNNNGSFNYELISGYGDEDNLSFTIVDDKLISNAIFNFEIKNTYSIRVRATNNSTNEQIDENIIINVLDIPEEEVLKECVKEVTNLAYGLNDVEFIDNQNVVAVGLDGLIIKSYDGGRNWKKITSDLYSHLYKLQFTSSTVGYAIGEKIFKTDDAGETWYPLEFPKSIDPFDLPSNLFFVNSDVGFAYGNEGQILKTINGGKYWKNHSYGGNVYNSAYFFNELEGFLCGNSKTLIKTADGGKTWERIELDIAEFAYNTRFTDIKFVNDQVGFISTEQGKIVKTIDGGNTWTYMGRASTFNSYTRIEFKNENEGYIMGVFYGVNLLKTIDGGLTWNEVSFDEYGSLKNISFSPDGNKSCLVGHGVSCCAGESTGNLIFIQEQDNDWEAISALSIGSDELYGVTFEEEIGYVFSNNILGKTIDGGVTWQKLNPPDERIIQLSVVNNIVYLLCQNNIYRSSDSGVTWNLIGESNNISNVHFISEDILFGLSSGSGIFKSTDGGANWINVSSDPYFKTDIYFFNESEGFVVGFNGMLKTEDGGNTWSQVVLEPIGGEQPLIYSINFIGDIGFSGSNVGLLKTENRGQTWERINKNTSGDVKFVYPITEFNWYAATNERLIETKDGGDTWSEIYYQGHDINDAHFTDGKVYLAGYKTLKEISDKSYQPVLGNMEGADSAYTHTKTSYNVVDNDEINYKWSVSGNNSIVYSRNKAEILWKTPGDYIVSVTPINDCGEGTKRELLVTVIDDNFESPTIEGDMQVNEFSLNNEYMTASNPESRYNWFVKGHQNFSLIEDNRINIDWGVSGLGEIEVIKTNLATGLRKKGFLNVDIVPVPLPSNNFNIEVISETCPNKDNGKIIISAVKTLDYVATINGITYNFTKDLTIENITPNSYELCISIPLKSYIQCYNIVVAEGTTVSGKSTVKSNNLSVQVISGTAPYTVTKNDQLQFQTYSKTFSLNVAQGDIVKVLTSKACEGSLSKAIELSDKITAYPNPTSGDFEITIPIVKKEVLVEIYSIQSRLISSSTYPVLGSKIQLNIKEKPNGVYFAKVYLDEPITLKIVKQ